MPGLFDNTTINGMSLANRMVRSATWEGMCDADGRPSARLIELYRELARGGVGLMVTGFTFVLPEGKQMPGKMGIHTDDFAPAYQEMTKAVHAEGGKIALQLVHAGGQASRESAGRQPVAPSSVQVDQYPDLPAALSLSDIDDIVAAFAAGARRAEAWGMDAVQLHGAHGYLINQFLSPLTNRRTDRYGGSIENRCRFMMEVYQAVREAVGADFPVMIKLNAADNLEGGLETTDALRAAMLLDQAGIDAIEVSAGTPVSGNQSPARKKINAPEKEAYNLEVGRRIKATVSCPVTSVGGYRSFEIAEKAIRKQGMDYIAFSRPLIRQPDLPRRWQQGDRQPATCISCNGCFGPGLEEGGIYCVVDKKERERAPQS